MIELKPVYPTCDDHLYPHIVCPVTLTCHDKEEGLIILKNTYNTQQESFGKLVLIQTLVRSNVM